MRIFFIVNLLFISMLSVGQVDISCKNNEDISFMERMAHERMFSPRNSSATTASLNFDVTYYRLEWEVDPAVNYIAGKVTSIFRMTSPGSVISFDLMNGLIVDSVKRNGVLLAKQHLNNLLEITFAQQLPAGSVDSVAIYYRGTPPPTGFGSFVQTTHAGVPVIWTLSEPYGSRDWWPCKNGLDDKADSIDVFITNPAIYKAASNGLLQSEVINGVKKTAHWKHRYPIASYLVCFAVTNYAVFNNTVQLGNVTLPMQTYCYPESLALFQANTPNVLNAMQLFHNTFGEYPFIKEKYGHVQFSWGGGMEHQTATFITGPNESLMAHELAHQWFGDKITCGTWRDIWLNEGFATHLASMYIEQKYPAATIPNRSGEINAITLQPGGSVWVDDTTSVARIFNNRLSYTKGSHLIYMLRWILGDQVFFQAVRRYLNDPAIAYKFARTPDLKRHLEEVSGKDLTYFFNQWYTGQGHPSFKVKWEQVGSSFVRINLSQTTSHASVPFFNLPVPLLFKNATQSKTVIIDAKNNNEVFLKQIGFVADTVLVDPEYWLISRNNTSQKISDASLPPSIQVFPNPVGNEGYVYFRNYNNNETVISLYDNVGKLVYRKNLAVSGAEVVELPFRLLARGVYVIKISMGSELKLIKQLVRL